MSKLNNKLPIHVKNVHEAVNNRTLFARKSHLLARFSHQIPKNSKSKEYISFSPGTASNPASGKMQLREQFH